MIKKNSLILLLTQYQNLVMKVKFKITIFCNRSQSLWYNLRIEVFRYQILILAKTGFFLLNQIFNQKMKKPLDFGTESSYWFENKIGLGMSSSSIQVLLFSRDKGLYLSTSLLLVSQLFPFSSQLDEDFLVWFFWFTFL
jgi:hypothetical protein